MYVVTIVPVSNLFSKNQKGMRITSDSFNNEEGLVGDMKIKLTDRKIRFL